MVAALVVCVSFAVAQSVPDSSARLAAPDSLAKTIFVPPPNPSLPFS